MRSSRRSALAGWAWCIARVTRGQNWPATWRSKSSSAAATDTDRRRRFELEARTTGALILPNILAIYDVGTYEGMLYLVEQLLDGYHAPRAAAAQPASSAESRRYARAIAQGLAAAHAKGIVPRDLKPETSWSPPMDG